MTNIMTNHYDVRDFCWLHFSPQVIVPDIENIEFTARTQALHCFYRDQWQLINAKRVRVLGTELYYISGDRALDFKVSAKTWRL